MSLLVVPKDGPWPLKGGITRYGKHLKCKTIDIIYVSKCVYPIRKPTIKLKNVEPVVFVGDSRKGVGPH